MFGKKLTIVFVIVLLLGSGESALALTLEEYGITPVSSGFIDNQSGLRWLDPQLTFGTSDVVDEFLSQGWTIATSSQVAFVLDRDSTWFLDIGNTSPLGPDQFLMLLDLLGVQANIDFSSPWMCRNYGSIDAQCGSTVGGWFEQFIVNVFTSEHSGSGDPLNSTTNFAAYSYISEAFLYGTYKTDCDTCTGRTLLVRPVPLPAGIWGFLASLGILGAIRRHQRSGA